MDYLPLEKQYLAAECVGKSGGDCDAAYPDCPHSPLDYISQTVQLEIFPDWNGLGTSLMYNITPTQLSEIDGIPFLPLLILRHIKIQQDEQIWILRKT